jgi:hypothetical protein
MIIKQNFREALALLINLLHVLVLVFKDRSNFEAWRSLSV